VTDWTVTAECGHSCRNLYWLYYRSATFVATKCNAFAASNEQTNSSWTQPVKLSPRSQSRRQFQLVWKCSIFKEVEGSNWIFKHPQCPRSENCPLSGVVGWKSWGQFSDRQNVNFRYRRLSMLKVWILPLKVA